MNYHYRPPFNAAVYGPAEARADRYWKKHLAKMERSDRHDRKAKKVLRGISY